MFSTMSITLHVFLVVVTCKVQVFNAFIVGSYSRLSGTDHSVLPANYSIPASTSQAFTRRRHTGCNSRDLTAALALILTLTSVCVCVAPRCRSRATLDDDCVTVIQWRHTTFRPRSRSTTPRPREPMNGAMLRGEAPSFSIATRTRSGRRDAAVFDRSLHFTGANSADEWFINAGVYMYRFTLSVLADSTSLRLPIRFSPTPPRRNVVKARADLSHSRQRLYSCAMYRYWVARTRVKRKRNGKYDGNDRF